MSRPVDQALVALLEKPVDVRKLVDRLFFSPDSLEKAALHQSKYQFEVGRLRTQLYMRKKSLERKLRRLQGKRGLRLRQKYDLKTEGAVKERLALDPAVQSIQKKFDEVGAYELAVEDLREAFKQRHMTIGFLNKLHVAEMVTELRDKKGEEAVDKLRKRADKLRKDFELDDE